MKKNIKKIVYPKHIFIDYQNYSPFSYSYCQTLENIETITDKRLFIPDVTNLLTVFDKSIYSYDCESETETEAFLSTIFVNGKAPLFDLLLTKANENDNGFFKKFVSCYMFSECGYDQELCCYLIRYCLNSSDFSLQKSGINLLSFFKREDRLIVDEFKDHKFSQPYLKNAFERALIFDA